MELRVIGCGDAFGSGGRLNTCFHVRGAGVDFLIDCGASSLIGLQAQQVARNDIQAIFFTHFHADHFGGLPFFVLDAQFARRTAPLTIVGPEGLGDWYVRAMETAFPGSSAVQRKFTVQVIELTPGRPVAVGGVVATGFQALHGPPGGPYLSLRLAAEGRVVTYSGDTEWTDDLIPAAAGADLFIAEAYHPVRTVKYHLDLATLEAHLPRLTHRRLILTHMGEAMLARLGAIGHETARDGLTIAL